MTVQSSVSVRAQPADRAPGTDLALARAAMVESQLRPQGVTDAAVLGAMGEIERERFVPEQARALAYIDRAVPLGGGRFLPAPAVLGALLTQMAPRPGQRALVVGAGTGYSVAVLSAMGLEVVGVESAVELAARAGELGVDVHDAPLEGGHAEGAPYDQILIDGAVSDIPAAIIGQLADGGTLGAALIDRGVSRLIVGRKAGGAFGYLTVSDAGSPPLPGFERPRSFTF
ncbi:protein-L-isoaspartate O-methyltransferase [Sphingomonas sp.]|uniref:protein-L-isoaspartate O-methyltransferase family protein n=1 Tax=Sphingomonas sp. TaxID=28214 RepID=UPI0025D73761|nr:protein-L-isoaspartate O-methyltransferase [Sphingomonas sp.]MBV9529462.1 protein-L-isoaspartate O-methyltransferase [Sphingomonas sp.]